MRTARGTLWYRDAAARRLILLGYLPWLAGLNLVWEAAHVPLYTLWNEAEPAYIAFAVAHCTLGDILIGGIALVLTLVLAGEGALERWRWRWVAAVTALFGVAYTGFSEWMNVRILRSWAYAESMPVIQLGNFELGVSPLAQWLIIPPLALYLARARRGEPRRRGVV